MTRRPAWEWLALGAIVAGAAALRLIDLGAVRLDPFYDAAVRSMGTSWKNLFFGAWEPGGSASIDKPPVDLWLQVGSVKLLGFGSTALKLPEALAGVAAVPLLYAAVRRVWGAAAGLGAALALAVMPIEAITSRSDTMDAVMMALTVLALLLVIRACETGRTVWLLAAAAALGVAFNVKLFESMVALPGLALIALLGFRGHRRVLPFAAAVAVYLVVSLSWLSATLLFPAHQRPYAIGSTNGSAWNAAFVFNGVDRITGKVTEGASPSIPPSGLPQATLSERERIPIPEPSATRLLSRIGPMSYERLGLEALVALLLGIPAVLLLGRRGPPLRGAVGVGLAVWLLTGLVLFSEMKRLHPRYVEGFTPAVAALLGIGVAWVGSLGPARWVKRGGPLLVVCLLALVLAIPLKASIRAVHLSVSDAGYVGALPAEELGPVSAYLRAHRAGARYEVAVDSATKASALIVRDGQPVVVLTTYEGRTLTGVAALERLIAKGEVRYALLTSACGTSTPRSNAACSPPALWIAAHARDISREIGLRGDRILWRLPRAVA